MTNKPMLSVERELLERIFEALEGLERLLGLKKQRIFPEHRRDKWDSEFAQTLYDGCLDGRNPLVTPREVNPEIAKKWEGWEEWPGRLELPAAGGIVDVRLRDGRVFIGCKVPFSGGQFPSNAAQFLWWLRKGEVKDDDIVGIRRLTEATAFGHVCSLKRYDDHKEVEGQIYVTYVECSPYSPKTDYRKYVMTFPAYGVKHTEAQEVNEKAKALFAIINPDNKWHKCPEDIKERYEAAAKAAAPTPKPSEQPTPVAVVMPFAEKVIAKLRRFEECAGDSQDVDIGRKWFDVLTHLGLLERVQRSPAYWEITQQGEGALEAARLNGVKT